MTPSEERLRDHGLEITDARLASLIAGLNTWTSAGRSHQPEIDMDLCCALMELQRLRGLSLRSDAHTSGEVKDDALAATKKAYDIINSGGPPYSARECQASYALSTALAAFDALSLGHPIQGEAVGYLHKPTGNVFSAKDHAILLPKWQRQFAADMTADEIAADFTPLFASPQPPTPAGVREITEEVEEFRREFARWDEGFTSKPRCYIVYRKNDAGEFDIVSEHEDRATMEAALDSARIRAALAAAKGAGE
jgi:quinol monooxygenase YgiN